MAERTSRSAGTISAAAEWPDVERLFGVRGEPSRCWCRFFALTGSEWSGATPDERKAQLRAKFDGGSPAPGVIAFRDGRAVKAILWIPPCAPRPVRRICTTARWGCSVTPGLTSSATPYRGAPSSGCPPPASAPEEARRRAPTAASE